MNNEQGREQSLEPETESSQPSLFEKLKSFEVPHPLVIIFIIVVLAEIATNIIPGGTFQRAELNGRTVVMNGSFTSIPHVPQGFFQLVFVPFNGMMQAADIIVLCFIIGGAFCIMKDTGALSAGINRVTQALKGREFIMIPVMMTVFALAGGVFGWCPISSCSFRVHFC